MENTVMVNGKMNFMGLEIPVVSGGFGESKMCILAKTVAEIHGVTVAEVNQNIKRNEKRFTVGKDIIDLKTHNSELSVLKDLGFTQAQIGNAKNIYLFSERGYAKLIKIMDDDKSWEVHDKLVDDYFNLRDKVQQLPMSPVEAYLAMSEEDRAIAYFTKVKEDKEKALLLEQQAPKVSYFDKFIDTDTTFTSTQVAKVYGLSSARKLNTLLKEKHVIYKQGKAWLIYETANKEWFKEVLNEFGTQLRFTALGVVEVAKLLDIELNEDEITENKFVPSQKEAE